MYVNFELQSLAWMLERGIPPNVMLTKHFEEKGFVVGND